MLAISTDNLISIVRSLVKEERRITREILDHINEVEKVESGALGLNVLS